MNDDFEIRDLVYEYFTSRSNGSSYETNEKICSLKTSQLKKFLQELVLVIKENFVDRRAERRRDLVEEDPGLKEGNSGIIPHDLGDEFLDKISLGGYEEVIEKVCKLDDSRNELLQFLGFTSGRISMYFENKRTKSYSNL